MSDIFDKLQGQPEKKSEDIFDKITSEPSRTRSILSAPIKGAIKGAAELASYRDPFAKFLGLSDLSPLQSKAIEQGLPTQERSLEKGLERGGRLAATAIGGPESLIAKGVRSVAGAALGQFAEEAGAPDFIQNLAELAAFASPKFGKNLLPKKSQKEMVNFLRSKGLNDREITPLIQSERKLGILSKISSKGKKTEKLFEDISGKLGENYAVLKEQGRVLKQPFLTGDAAVKFDDKLSESLEKISPRFQRLVKEDLAALRNKGITVDNLMNFYQDINATIKGQTGGKAVLGILKKPILEGMKEIDPKIAEDFTKLNSFYAKKAQLSKGLKKDIVSKLLTGGKTLGALGSIATGNFGILSKILTAESASLLARELMINPRLQNLSHQMLKSISKNQIPIALKLLEEFKNNLENEKLKKELQSLE